MGFKHVHDLSLLVVEGREHYNFSIYKNVGGQLTRDPVAEFNIYSEVTRDSISAEVKQLAGFESQEAELTEIFWGQYQEWVNRPRPKFILTCAVEYRFLNIYEHEIAIKLEYQSGEEGKTIKWYSTDTDFPISRVQFILYTDLGPTQKQLLENMKEWEWILSYELSPIPAK